MKVKSYGLRLLIFAIILCTACKKSNSGDMPASTNTGTVANTVNISNMSFGANITIKQGETVTWVNKDYSAHTVSANDGSFESGDINTNGTYSHQFLTKGSFTYHCKYHSMMISTVVVN